MSEETMSILRIKKSLHEKAKELAEANHMTLSSFTEKAVEEYIEKMKYNLELLMKKVNDYPLLSIYQDFIKKEFFDAPNNVIRDIYKILDKTTTLNRFSADNKLLKNVLKDNVKGLLIITTNNSPEMSIQVNEILDFITSLKLKNVILNFVLRKNEAVKDKPEIMVFLSRIKEDDKNEKI